jgi:hypothetical protein
MERCDESELSSQRESREFFILNTEKVGLMAKGHDNFGKLKFQSQIDNNHVSQAVSFYYLFFNILFLHEFFF